MEAVFRKLPSHSIAWTYRSEECDFVSVYLVWGVRPDDLMDMLSYAHKPNLPSEDVAYLSADAPEGDSTLSLPRISRKARDIPCRACATRRVHAPRRPWAQETCCSRARLEVQRLYFVMLGGKGGSRTKPWLGILSP